MENIKRWWYEMVEVGPLYGYYPNSSKTQEKRRHISTDGKSYLGGAIGSTFFIKHFMASKVNNWVNR